MCYYLCSCIVTYCGPNVKFLVFICYFIDRLISTVFDCFCELLYLLLLCSSHNAVSGLICYLRLRRQTAA